MNVLFVGNYRDGTGWSYAAIDYMRALVSVGINVACRPVRFALDDVTPPDDIKVLEQGDYGVYDAVIQNVLPHHLDYNGSYPRNIALYYTETTSLGRTRWADRINCMDSAWVSCQRSRQASISSGVTIPVDVVHIACDVRKYEQNYEPLLIREKLTDQFVFYTIGEFNKRKNLRALLSAFHLEFDINEPVSLLIKTTPKSGESEWDARRGLAMYCDSIKAGLKLYDEVEHYKNEVLITGRYSDQEIMRLHTSCDCGVFPSHGEAWGIPTFDSMALGKTPITTAWGGYLDYMSDEVGWMVPATQEPAYGTQLDTFPDLHTAREEWAAISIAGLRAAMRSAYTDDKLRKQKALNGVERAYDFTYKKIGTLMKGLLS